MMHFARVTGFSVLMALGLSLITSEVVVAQKKKDAKNKVQYPTATPEDYKAIQNRKDLVGKYVSSDTGNLTIRLEYPQQQANPNFKGNAANPQGTQQANLMRQYADLQLQYQRAATARTPREAQVAQQRIAQDMARIQQQIMQMNGKAGGGGNPNNQPFITVVTTKDFDLEIKEGATVRKMFLPFEYDDTGNPKAYTEKEKLELRGTDKTKPGYMAKLEELQPGMEIRLTLVPPPAKKKAAPKNEDKDAAPADMTPERPTITMVLATKDVPGAGMQGAGPNDNKKKKKN